LFVDIGQVFPGGWTAILISLDNVGSWNLRSENLDRWYLGQETYLRIINPEENGDTEMAAPDNVLYCGALKSLQKYTLFLMLHWYCFITFCLLFLNVLCLLRAGRILIFLQLLLWDIAWTFSHCFWEFFLLWFFSSKLAKILFFCSVDIFMILNNVVIGLWKGWITNFFV